MNTFVVNRKDIITGSHDVNIMRPGPWGNPFIIGVHGTRTEVVEKHRQMVYRDNELQKKIRKELSGKRLVCCCKPKACHGDVLAEVANAPQIEFED